MRWFSEKHKDSHQRRLTKKVIESFKVRLDAHKAKLEAATTFEDVEAIIAGCRVKGIGPLTVYDTALRLCLYRGMVPAKVYLHAGTRIGAVVIDERFRKASQVEREDFPAELQGLEPWEIEDFLCICKDQLKRLYGR
jgi:hypothetical protein